MKTRGWSYSHLSAYHGRLLLNSSSIGRYGTGAAGQAAEEPLGTLTILRPRSSYHALKHMCKCIWELLRPFARQAAGPGVFTHRPRPAESLSSMISNNTGARTGEDLTFLYM
jgi:hypothetical protein